MKPRLKRVILVCTDIFLIFGVMFLIKNCSFNNAVIKASDYNKTKLTEYSNFTALENITVSFEGKKLNLTSPIYVENNRYYFPLKEIINSINGEIIIKNGIADIEINRNKIKLNTKENYFILNYKKFDLKKSAILSENIVYVSLFDLTKMFNFKTVWDEENNNIGLFWNRDNIVEDKQPESGKTALIRFEDITTRYSTSDSLEKLRIIFDYCYSKNIPMHLGWVPRYIDAKNNIDNDLAEKYSIHNADFIYTLDYFADKNGLIGLHGYTHQYGDEVSVAGTEFNSQHNASEKSVRERLNYAIDDAKKLEIPITFFESPHYAATVYQKKIIEEYFDNIYEYRLSASEKNISKKKVGKGNEEYRVVKYIPTPLGYVQGKEDTNNMIAKIKALQKDDLGSFFYHPYIEFEFITIKKGINGYPSYEYSNRSPFHKIVNTFIGEGYKFKDIKSL